MAYGSITYEKLYREAQLMVNKSCRRLLAKFPEGSLEEFVSGLLSAQDKMTLDATGRLLCGQNDRMGCGCGLAEYLSAETIVGLLWYAPYGHPVDEHPVWGCPERLYEVLFAPELDENDGGRTAAAIAEKARVAFGVLDDHFIGQFLKKIKNPFTWVAYLRLMGQQNALRGLAQYDDRQRMRRMILSHVDLTDPYMGGLALGL